MVETIAASRSRGSRALWLTIAVLVAAVLLHASLRGIDWTQVRRTIGAAEPGRLLLAALLVTAALFLRALRWRVLLSAGARIDSAAVFWATAAGLFGNNFLPARAGEVVRTVMIGSRSTLTNAFVLATALSERIADAVALVVISAVALLMLPSPPGWLAHAARPFAIVGLIGAAAIAVLPLLAPAGRTVLGRAPLSDGLRSRLTTTMDDALSGLRAFHEGRRLAVFLLLTIAIWCLDAFGTIVTSQALGFQMPLPVAFLLIAALGVASAVPSTPGYVGVYQFVAVTVLTPFGFSRSAAIAYILVAQALTIVVIGIWGSIGLARYRRVRAA